jgi:hypothetical protein
MKKVVILLLFFLFFSLSVGAADQYLNLSKSGSTSGKGYSTFYRYVPLSQEVNFKGFTGSVAITSSSGSFSQLLAIVYYNPNDNNCSSSNPSNSIELGRYILKDVTHNAVSVNTDVLLPAGVPIKGCVFIAAGGGDNWDGGNVGLKSNMYLVYDTPAVPATPAYWILAMDYGFCFGFQGCQAYTSPSSTTALGRNYRFTTRTRLWASYGDVSAATLPGDSGPSSWTSYFDYYLYRNCSYYGERWGNWLISGNLYSQIPSNAVALLNLDPSTGGYTQVQVPGQQNYTLWAEPGDCLVALSRWPTGRGRAYLESQIMFLLQDDPLPVGYLDGVDCNVFGGWTCDGSSYANALNVHFYADGPAGSGTFLGAASANLPREPAVGDLCGDNVNHGYSFSTPAGLKDGRQHMIYAYALSIPAGDNPLLGSKTLLCTTTTTSTTSTTTSSTTSTTTSTPATTTTSTSTSTTTTTTSSSTTTSTSSTTSTSTTTSSTSSSSTTTSTTVNTTTSTTPNQCVMPGNDPPCDEVTLSEAIDGIYEWVEGNLRLGEVIDLINSWADPAVYFPN